MAEDEVPRAKRLKLLREAKARKGRQLRGKDVEEAEPEALAVVKEAEKQQDADVPEVSELRIAPTGDEEERLVERKEQEGAEEEEEEEEELTLAPKRANWDIERDIAPMLKKLEKRTQHAIVEILRAFCMLLSANSARLVV